MTPQSRMRPCCRSRSRTGAIALLGCLALWVGACGSKRVTYVVGDDPWTGPPMELGSTTTVRTATFEVPTSGWTVELDYTETRFGRVLAYVTLTKPDPGRMVSQVLTSHTISLDADADQPVDVHARVVPHGDEPSHQRVYSPVN